MQAFCFSRSECLPNRRLDAFRLRKTKGLLIMEAGPREKKKAPFRVRSAV
jgi:hypothetical protein